MRQLDELFADYSIDFLKSRKGAKQPFFLYHATTGVHFDNYPAEQWQGKSPAGYPVKDVMVQLDDIAGRLVRTLQETGQLEDTLVFVTSDNGPEMETWPDSAVTPFRGSKGTTWEGGVRVPGIAYWPGVIKPGRESDGLFDLGDLFATALTLAGAEDKVPDRSLHRQHRPDVVPAGGRWRLEPEVRLLLAGRPVFRHPLRRVQVHDADLGRGARPTTSRADSAVSATNLAYGALVQPLAGSKRNS